MFSRSDFTITFLVTLLLSIGLMAVYSATSFANAENYFFNRQLIFAVAGLILMFIFPFIPFRMLERLAYPFYILSVLLLILVYFVGTKGFGAERWLAIGPIKLQPSELAKIATVLAIGRYSADREVNVNRLRHFFGVVILALIPFILIIRQPDLGTSLVFLAILIPLLFWAGLRWFPLFLIISPAVTVLTSFNIWYLLAWLILIAAILFFSRQRLLVMLGVLLLHGAIGAATPSLWNQLHPYQKNRILTFLNPEHDPRGAGYQIIQSQVAIGSGGVWGKGFLNGTQTHLKFLPAQHTDFIFSVLAEEWGFTGVMTVLLLFLLLILYLISLAATVKSKFSGMVLFGIAAILFFHVFVNIGMTVGIAPVTGLPLPFISYGRSFLLTMMLTIGIAQNLSYNRLAI